MPFGEHHTHMGYGESGRRDAEYYSDRDWSRMVVDHPETCEVAHARGAHLVRHRDRPAEVYRYDREMSISYGPVVICQPMRDEALIREAFGG